MTPASISTSARAKARLNSLAWALVLFGAVQFVLAVALAMTLYPGGTLFDPDRPGYSFWTNSFSDLGRWVSISGRPNHLSAVLYNCALAILAATFAPLWLVLGQLMPNRRRVAWAMRACGLLSIAGMLGVAFTPADVATFWHMTTIGLASVPAFAAAILCAIGMAMDRSCPRWLAALTAGLVVPAGLHFWQYVNHFWLGGPWTPAAPAVQKVLALYVMAWLMVVSGRQLWARKAALTGRPPA